MELYVPTVLLAIDKISSQGARVLRLRGKHLRRESGLRIAGRLIRALVTVPRQGFREGWKSKNTQDSLLRSNKCIWEENIREVKSSEAFES